MSRHPSVERHFISRIGWLRAAVLGANDGIISTAALIVGVAASPVDKSAIWISGLAALVAGALSMATGEYVSVSSQADSEAADLKRETDELRDFPEDEHAELRDIYISRGLTPELATEVAAQLMQHDALGAHARDELGLSEHTEAKPIQAAMASAVTFASGALLPIVIMALSPRHLIVPAVSLAAIAFLAVLGAIGARTGGAGILKPVLRVTFWGVLALAVTAGIGHLFGVAA